MPFTQTIIDTGIICTIVLATTSCNTYLSWQYLPSSVEDEKTIFIVNHGWHTGVVISANNLGPELSFLNTHFNNSLYYEIGWGDKDFYQARQVTSGITMRAIFLPTASVVHVVSLTQHPSDYFSDSKLLPIKISNIGHHQLNQSITQSFKRSTDGMVIKSQPGLYGDSWFFASNDSFYITNNCNSWTANKLASAGVPINTYLTITANSVMKQIQQAKEKRLKKQ